MGKDDYKRIRYPSFWTSHLGGKDKWDDQDEWQYYEWPISDTPVSARKERGIMWITKDKLNRMIDERVRMISDDSMNPRLKAIEIEVKSIYPEPASPSFLSIFLHRSNPVNLREAVLALADYLGVQFTRTDSVSSKVVAAKPVKPKTSRKR